MEWARRGAVLEAKAIDRITLLAKRSSSGGTAVRSHDDDGVLAAIRGIDQLHFKAIFPTSVQSDRMEFWIQASSFSADSTLHRMCRA